MKLIFLPVPLNKELIKDPFWWFGLILGPAFFCIFLFFVDLVPGKPEVSIMAGITLWIASWWMTEVVDLAVTSMLPLVLLPLTGIMDARTAAIQYNDQVIFLFVGGFILSFAIEKWGLHKRISLKVLSLIGSSPVNILAGIMLSTAFISMWMSNTATVMMLLSAVLAIIYHIETEVSEKHSKKIGAALLLGLAYAGSIGGMATLVGTPTNMIFSSYYQSNFPDKVPVAFFEWFKLGFPVAILLLVATYLILKQIYLKKETNIRFDKTYFKDAYKTLGKFSYEEKWVIVIFGITALLWFTRSNMDMGMVAMTGWSQLFKNPEFIQDSTVAVFMATLLFIIPGKKNKGEALLVWEDVKKLPYDIILLFGSGFALAKGFEVSGLSNWLAAQLNFLKGFNPYLMVLGVCFTVCIISEFASNVASIQLVLPILSALSISVEVDPLILMIPATLAASLGFMLPVATAANTIVFGTKKVPLRNMLRSGFWIDLAGIILISFVGLALLE